MADGMPTSATGARGRRTSQNIVRALVFGLAIMPCAAAAAAPIWVAPALIDTWGTMLHLDELQHRAFVGGAWAMILSFVGLKFAVPLLVALDWPYGTRVGFAAPAVWAVAVVASFIVVARGVGRFIPQLE